MLYSLCNSDKRCISIHALREEGDLLYNVVTLVNLGFLSTPSARRATIARSDPDNQYTPISIHALREEGDQATGKQMYLNDISIHALREEGDFFRPVVGVVLTISIHALREEGDHW